MKKQPGMYILFLSLFYAALTGSLMASGSALSPSFLNIISDAESIAEPFDDLYSTIRPLNIVAESANGTLEDTPFTRACNQIAHTACCEATTIDFDSANENEDEEAPSPDPITIDQISDHLAMYFKFLNLLDHTKILIERLKSADRESKKKKIRDQLADATEKILRCAKIIRPDKFK